MMYQQNPYQNNIYTPYDRNQYQQNVVSQMQSIFGKVVDSDAEITVNDVPMNGQPAIFPSRDMGKIEARKWNADGTISRVVYVPQIDVSNDNATNSTPSTLESLNDRFNELEKAFNDRFDKLESAIAPKTTRKKVSDDANE